MLDSQSQQKLVQFVSQFPLIKYQKGDSLMSADDEPQGVFYLKSGFVKLYALSLDGRELTLNLFKPDTYFSMMWTIGDISNDYYFQALTDTQTYRIPKQQFINFLQKEPVILFDFTKRIVSGLQGTVVRMEHLLFGSAYHRTVSVFIMLIKRFGIKENNKIKIAIPLTHQEIANLAGLSRETTTLQILELEKNKILSQSGRYFYTPAEADWESKLQNATTAFVESPQSV